MFSKVLIANRGEILGRVCRTLRDMGIRSVAVYSDADRFSPNVLAADEALRIGPPSAAESYLNIDAIIRACQETGAQAVHPGYGFLSERVEFAERLAASGIKFIGPRPEHLRGFGMKHTARDLAQKAGVPMLPGTSVLSTLEEALAQAKRITYPVMLKSSAGGGGIGMVLCHNNVELGDKYDSIARLAENNFGNAALFLEKYVVRARHVEVQIFGDGKGGVVAFGARDCSLQRRNQKVVEETPAPNLFDATLAAMQNAAVALASSVQYESAGTVEFIYDAEVQEFYFLEMNTRLQVEHGVTEEIYSVDFVRWMIEQAAGTLTLPAQATLKPQGAAIEVRIYAENPGNNFAPSSGMITAFKPGPSLRVEKWVEAGTDVSPFYDPMLAKFIASGPSRAEALANLQAGLKQSEIFGIETNLDYLQAILALPDFIAGEMTTSSLTNFAFMPYAAEVLDPGAQSSLQSLPGRLGYWEVGVPPSGPMDDLHHNHANALLGNRLDAVALELTHTGPTLRFFADTLIALSGAHMPALLDETPIPYHQPVSVKAGQVLELGVVEGPGHRTYLAISGGFRAPDYLGSTATFTLGGFGGATGNALRAGDTLRFNPSVPVPATPPLTPPAFFHDWDIAVLYGPHGAPDFFTDKDISTIFAATYEVHHNSARTGVRLIGPKPEWARRDGGEAGLHPSNIHDNAYAIGAIDFTGDMPILLGPDGPSLGGFVCPAVVTKADRWKLGQLKPGDKLRFVRADTAPAIISTHKDVVVRRAGDEDILIEFGEMKLDFELRLRAQALRDALEAAKLPGVVDLTPGIRSLQVHFDSTQTTPMKMLAAMEKLLPTMPVPEDMVVRARTVYLPLSWNDSQIRLSMRKYQETTRPNAPWCPDNIEFIRRINGLDSIEDVKRIIFDASYVVLGLGDVYLGAPVATPYDPRHRLVTTKYNPARPWTPQNAVGIGGAYMCVYGMEGPGGYQLFGRTVQVWNTHRQTPPFEPGKPWLLRHFDRIRFIEVSEEELLEARDAFPQGKYQLRIEESQFSLRDYHAFCAENAESIVTFQTRQRAAFAAEREDWALKGLNSFEEPDIAPEPEEMPLPVGSRAIAAPVPGSIWQILAEPGALVQRGDVVMILESMKMEVRVRAVSSGRISSLSAVPGQAIRAGQRLGVIASEAH
ncbi:5-oxoprolinase/urea amidolyase family protein [Acidocella sp.]|uniref:5-oxoprolinase/urea amidolyase family protein n=1 Tax=Acidocella sp. TaxID=50710 RepID=UPI0026065510|nr:5-oxoprolinase/urea amidolyase family protein [Acidocella sp.]